MHHFKKTGVKFYSISKCMSLKNISLEYNVLLVSGIQQSESVIHMDLKIIIPSEVSQRQVSYGITYMKANDIKEFSYTMKQIHRFQNQSYSYHW